MTAQCVYRTAASEAYSSDVATFDDVDLGTPDATRNVVVWTALALDDGTTPSDVATVEIGSKDADLVDGSSSIVVFGSIKFELCCFTAAVPTGTTADIKVTLPGASGSAIIGVFTTYGALSTVSDVAASTASPGTLDCDVSTDSALAAFSLALSSSGTITTTWTGLNENADSTFDGTTFYSAASLVATGAESPRSITATPSSTPDVGYLSGCVVFAAKPFVSQVRNLLVNARGRAAIWTGDDDEPFKYPRQHLDRVKFHTDLDYIKIIREIPFTLSLPALDTATYGTSATFTHKLFDHNLGHFPFILGETVVGGEPVAMAGSIPIQSGDGSAYYGRWLALGADDTSVYVHEYVVFTYSGSGSSTPQFAAIDVPITVYLTDELLDVDTPRPPVGQATELSFRGARFADGLFDSNNRYIRQVSDPANKTLNMARGPTIEITRDIQGVATNAAWRWRVNEATMTGVAVTVTPPDDFNTPLDISLGGVGTPGKRGDFSARAGRIVAKGPLGRTVFDTDDGLFHTIDKLSGPPISIPTLTFSSGNDVNATTDQDLGPCDPACTDVIGSVKFTLNNYEAGMAFDRWHAMFGGSSALWVIDGHGLTGSSPDPNINILQMVWYSFLVIDGRVILRRRAYCSQNSRGTYQILSHQIDYKLKMGLFT